jgi:segregation and condensation protein B
VDDKQIKNILEAALLGSGKPLSLEVLFGLLDKGSGPDRKTLKDILGSLASDYEGRGIQLIEVGTGYRIQIRSSMGDWLMPLWAERPPRYSGALLETLALIAYRQPITRGEIEQVRGVAVSTNMIRAVLERGWIHVIGHRDVPGKPALFGTTKEFLDYFGLKRLEDLPPLSDVKDLKDLNMELALPEPSQQSDFLENVQDETKPDLLVTIDSDAFIKRDKEVEESDFSSKKNLKAPLKC